jgi:peptidoglycan/LPS O-acetylase OafA/YrhL
LLTLLGIPITEINFLELVKTKIRDMSAKRRSAIDMGDHGGLRGIMAIWVVVFHALFYTQNGIDIQGSSLMPMFFLLSGFSLTIGYYSKLLGKSPAKVPEGLDRLNVNQHATSNSAASPTVTVVVLPSSDKAGYSAVPNSDTNVADLHTESSTNKPVAVNQMPTLTYSQFMLNRLVRVLPAYYIGTCLAIPPVLYGYGELNPNFKIGLVLSFITSYIPVSTWFLFLLGGPLDGPGWTVQSLIGMWLMFPMVLRFLDKRTDVQLLQWIRYLYWIQLYLLAILTAGLIPFLGFWPAFCLGTMHPFSRIWCFAMGVAAGILCLRYQHEHEMPWFTDSSWFFPLRSWNCKCCSALPDRLFGILRFYTNQDFEQTMFLQTYAIVAITLIYTAGDFYVRYQSDYKRSNDGAIWFQALVPFAQLNIIVAMTRHSHRVIAKVSAATSSGAKGSSSAVGDSAMVATTAMVAATATLGQQEQMENGTATAATTAVRDDGPPTNAISRFLRHPINVWLGELSMSIYLVHYPLAFYITWANRGKVRLEWPDHFDCTKFSDDDANHAYQQCEDALEAFNKERAWPQWLFVVLPFISIAVGWLVYQYVERPFNKLKI